MTGVISVCKYLGYLGKNYVHEITCDVYRFDFSLTQIGVICGVGSTDSTVCGVT